MSDKILQRHLQRLAAIYIRQSSEGQVKHNPESYRVQQGLRERAIALGWTADRLIIVDGDMAVSAKDPGQRDAFEQLLQQIRNGEIGIVFSVDVSRLSRNSVDFSLLTHWCALKDALVGDLQYVLNPAVPQDGLVLGIQSVMAIHELHCIRDRMHRGAQQKASRGELHLGIPIGYVVIETKHLRKHGDARVQRAVEYVFSTFEHCVSVSELYDKLQNEGFQLPRPIAGSHGEQVQWLAVTYRSLLKMLRNPVYSGVYIYPRHVTQMHRNASGKLTRKIRATAEQEWQVKLTGHHPAYLSEHEFQVNNKKIAMNAQRNRPSGGAPRTGSALLGGLLLCRHCQHKMHVIYSSKGNARYRCRSGFRQREDASVSERSCCFSFAAEAIELEVAEQVLWTVSPGGVAASELAYNRLQEQRDSERQRIVDELSHAQYEADLTRRRFNSIDPSNRLVFETLARELEVNLQQVELQTQRLTSFEQNRPQPLLDAQRCRLNELGGCVETIWNHPDCNSSVKKQIVRLLIDHIYAELDATGSEVILEIMWHGGHHTIVRSPASRRRYASWQAELPKILDTLRKLYDDASIARILNRTSVPSGDVGKSSGWTAEDVRMHRTRHAIVEYSSSLQAQQGWLTQNQAATSLGISPMSISRMIEAKILPAEGNRPLPRVVRADDLLTQAVQAAVKRCKAAANAPLPTNPNQLTLDF
jgi:DNA invertase Pin-like site-specific DNA recombinase